MLDVVTPDAGLSSEAGESRTLRSYCRVCTAQCGILVDLEGEQVVAVRGDKEHPVSKGYTCPKGRALGQMHHHPQRIERPLMRGPDGVLAPVSWEECLDDIAAKLRAVIEKHGPASVGIFFGSGIGMDPAGFRMAEALHRAIGTPAKFSPLTIDGTAKTYVASVVGGFPGLGTRPAYEQAKMVVYLGTNPMVSHGHVVAMCNPALTIKAAARQGEVWVIDPRRSDTVGFATHHMAPLPGTDYAVLAYVVRELLAEGAPRAQRAVGLDELRAAVAPFTRAHAARIAGLPEAELDVFLASIRKAGRVAMEAGTGITMSQGGNLTIWLAWVIMVLTDSMNRPGGVAFHPGFINRMDMAPVPVFNTPTHPGPASRPELPGIVGDWPCSALPDEIEAGNIKAFLNLGGSLLRSFPDANALAPALQKLELLMSIEIIENETTSLSSHVLPTKDQLERPDFTLWDFLSARVNAQYTPAMVPPLGERRAAWWIFAGLMRRLGAEPPGPLPADDRAAGADDEVLSRLLAHARCSFEELAESRYVEKPFELPAKWVDEHIERFGGWHVAPADLCAQLESVSAAHLATRQALGSFSLIPRRQRRHVNAQFLFLGDKPELLLNPEDAGEQGLADGQPIIVRSARGEVSGVIKLDEGMRRGVVSFPHGHEGANVNRLTDAKAADRLTGMARYSGFAVTLHPVGAEEFVAGG
jgi:anaerobic selenocysteine-containing dehydrogenase